MQNNKPGNVFLYDSLDIPNEQKKPVHSRERSINPVVFIITLIFSTGFFMFLHYWSFQLIESYNEQYQILGWVLLITLYLSIVAVLITTVILWGMYGYNKVRRIALINIMEHQTTLDRLQSVENQYLNVMNERARQSLFSGVQNLTYSPSSTSQVVPPSAPVEEPTISAALEEDLPVLSAMKEQGLIGRSGNSILLGFGE
jgi:hypothetical protein